jgi:cytoskeletal protein RodZ
MEELIKYVALVVVLAIVAIGMWAFITSTQAAQAAAATATATTTTAATSQSTGTGSGWDAVFYGYSPPSTNIYINDASGNYWRRFYSSSYY